MGTYISTKLPNYICLDIHINAQLFYGHYTCTSTGQHVLAGTN